MDGKNSLGCNTKTEGPKQINRGRLPWCDITDAEKVERLRVLLKCTQETINRLKERLYKSEQIANEHQHGADGAVLVRAGRDYGGSSCPTEQCQPGKEWF